MRIFTFRSGLCSSRKEYGVYKLSGTLEQSKKFVMFRTLWFLWVAFVTRLTNDSILEADSSGVK